MARSRYIYVLTTQGGSDPAHAFTVKHELIAHMRRFGGLKGRNVFRLGDGRGGEIVSSSAEDYLALNG